MAIKSGYQINFQTMLRAAKAGDLALMECTDKISGKPVIVICCVNNDGEEYEFTPIAKMFDGNPYEELTPP